MIPKRCKICRGHVIGNNSFVCNDCDTFREYKKNYKIKPKPIDVLPFLHFNFENKSMANDYENNKGLMLGGHYIKDLKTGKENCTINLYRLKDKSFDDILHWCVMLCNHELTHRCISEIEPSAMQPYDNIYKRHKTKIQGKTVEVEGIEVFLGLREEDE